MKEILLTHGKVTFVDDCDYEYLIQWKWCCHKLGRNEYADSNELINGYYRTIRMHRIICKRMGLEFTKKDHIDHIDGNSLNNCRKNLRVATVSQNIANSRLWDRNQSGFKGVHWRQSHHKWVARLGVNHKRLHLGYFDNPRDAAKAYNDAALKYFGEFARLNVV